MASNLDERLKEALGLYCRDIERKYGGRTVGKTLTEDQVLERIKQCIDDTNEEAISKAFVILASLIHKDYSAGPDGFRIYKDDISKYMGKAKQQALEKPKPLLKNFPRFS